MLWQLRMPLPLPMPMPMQMLWQLRKPQSILWQLQKPQAWVVQMRCPIQMLWSTPMRLQLPTPTRMPTPMATAQLVSGAPGQAAQRVATEGDKVEAGVWRVQEEVRQGDLVHLSGNPGDATHILVPQMLAR